MAEFLGTFVLIAFGDGVVAMAVAALPGSGRAATPTTIFLAAGDWLLITWGWAIAVAFAVWVAGGVSGAHLNPAVTLAFAVRRKFAWAQGPALLGRSGGRRVRRCRAGLARLRRRDQRVQPRREDTKSGGQALATFSIFATFPRRLLPRLIRRAADRPDRRHRVPADASSSPSSTRGTPPSGPTWRRSIDRLRRGRDRHVLRRERRLRDQPGP